MEIKKTKAWKRQHELKKIYSYEDVPTINEIELIISNIKIGKVDQQEQSKRARALFAMYYLTAARASEITKTKKLLRRKIKTNTIFEEGIKKIIYQVSKSGKPLINIWKEEHNFLGTMKKDLKFTEYSGKKFLDCRIENRKNKNRKSKLLPIPIDKEINILKFILDYIENKDDDFILFPFCKRRASQIINETTRFNLHFIRHIRATHLITLYRFNEQMLIRFMGWSDSRPAQQYVELRSTDLAREYYKNG